MESKTSNFYFSVLQWNTLSSSLADQLGFPLIPEKFLKWDYRKNLIQQQLEQMKPDLVCLEEVDQQTFYENIFNPLGYYCFYKQKAQCPVPGGIPDGLFLAIKKEKFNIIQEPVYQIYQEQNGKNMNQFFGICKLQYKLTQQPHEIWFIGTHLKAREGCEERRIQQANQLVKYLQNQTEIPKNLGIILCGDLNSESQNKSIQIIKNAMNLNSVYEKTAFTTFTMRDKEFCKVIDYILINNIFDIIEITELPSKQSLGKQGLPNEFYPSDHLPLLTYLKLKENP